MKFDRTKMIEAPRRVIQRVHYPLEVMLVCVRWYATYPLRFRNIEQGMVERGVLLDHSTLHRWFIMLLPVLAATFAPKARGRSELGNRRDLREDRWPVEVREQHRRARPPRRQTRHAAHVQFQELSLRPNPDLIFPRFDGHFSIADQHRDGLEHNAVAGRCKPVPGD